MQHNKSILSAALGTTVVKAGWGLILVKFIVNNISIYILN